MSFSVSPNSAALAAYQNLAAAVETHDALLAGGAAAGGAGGAVSGAGTASAVSDVAALKMLADTVSIGQSAGAGVAAPASSLDAASAAALADGIAHQIDAEPTAAMAAQAHASPEATLHLLR